VAVSSCTALNLIARYQGSWICGLMQKQVSVDERRRRRGDEMEVECPVCKIKIDRDDIEDNGLCAVCNGAEND